MTMSPTYCIQLVYYYYYYMCNEHIFMYIIYEWTLPLNCNNKVYIIIMDVRYFLILWAHLRINLSSSSPHLKQINSYVLYKVAEKHCINKRMIIMMMLHILLYIIHTCVYKKYINNLLVSLGKVLCNARFQKLIVVIYDIMFVCFYVRCDMSLIFFKLVHVRMYYMISIIL